MAVPTQQGFGTLATGSNASISVSAPTCQNNDILILTVGTYASDAIAADNSYTELYDTGYVHVYWKRTTGTESTTSVSGATDSVVGFITVVRGCVTSGSPIGSETLATNTGTDSTIEAPSFSTNAAEEAVIICYGVADNNTVSGTTYGNLSNGSQNNGGTNTGSDTKAGLIFGTLASAGSIGTPVATQAASDAWRSIAFALKAEVTTTSTAASTLSGALSSSATITRDPGPITVTAASNLSGESSGTFGNTATYGTYGSNLYNYISGSRFTISSAVSVSKLSARLYNGGSAAYVKALIYAEGTNTPAALIAAGTATEIPAEITPTWYDLPFGSAVDLSAGTYWLMYVGDINSTTIYNDRTTSAGWGGYSTQVAGNYSSPPDNPTMATTSTRNYSVYATYTSSSNLLSSSADLTHTAGETPTTLTAASQFTQALTAEATITRDPGAITVSAASQFTQALSASTTMTQGLVTTSGLVAEYVGSLAEAGTAPGDNTNTRDYWDDLTGSYDGTLGTFDWDDVDSGWDGSGTAADPYRLLMKGDGTDNVRSAVEVVENAGTNGFTFEAWAKVPDSAPGDINCVVSQRDSVGGTYQVCYLGFSTTADQVRLYYRPQNGSGATATAPVTFGTGIHHIVGVFQTGTNGMKVYVDGSNSGATNATPATPTTVDDADLAIGGLWSGAAWQYPYTGAVATVRIYNKALSASEVSENYGAGILADSNYTQASPVTLDTVSSEFTSHVTSSATISEEFTTAASSTLSGSLSSSVTLSYTPPDRTSTAASQFTGAVSASTTIDYTPPARTSTAASQFTGMVSSSATVTRDAGPITSTASSQFTGTISASTDITAGIAPVTLDTVSSTLSGAISCSATIEEAFPSTAASTLTGPLSAAASITSLLAITSTAASQVTGALSAATTIDYTPPARTSTAAAQLTGALSASTEITNTAPSATTLTASSQLTGALTASATAAEEFTINAASDLTIHNIAIGLSSAPTLTGALSSSASISGEFYASSQLTGTVSSSATILSLNASAESTLTGMVSSSATVTSLLAITSTSAPQLTGMVSGSATAYIPGPTTSTAASQFTGMVSASTTLEYTPPARTSTAAAQLTGMVSASTTLSYTPPARTSTAASQLTGMVSSSATVSLGGTSVTINAASDLSLHSPANFTVRPGSSLTSTPPSSAANIVSGTLNITITGASTITENAPAPRMVAGHAIMTSLVTSLASLFRSSASSAASQLTGTISSSATISRTALSTTSTASSTLAAVVSSTASISRQNELTGASDLTAVTSSSADIWQVPSGENIVSAYGTIPAISSGDASISSSSFIATITILPNLSSHAQINRETLTGWVSGEGIIVGRCSGSALVRVKIRKRHTRLYGKIGRTEDTTLRVKHKGGAIWPSI